ncbi:hypothetical protein [Colwellia psychrerythraea]|uniref:Uncharacterized protein n=1 Tax=Colwellia psychrerythraea TaxID=28229 RepID=A0A099KIV9_COLPS|nr:hypothetical protein [Colwellia psychrerythraea]KGJ89523.1 hypothetical protein GAB14E_0716 [Colwellia psychrerythraea]
MDVQSDNNESVLVKFFGAEFSFTGIKTIKKFFQYGLVVLAFFIIFQTEISVLFNKYIHPEKHSQKQHLNEYHNDVLLILEAWDSVIDIDDRSKKSVAFIRENIDMNLARYGKLQTNLLSEVNQITWLFHAARLKIIEADITSDRKAIMEAVTLLKKAKDKSNDPVKLTKEDTKFLKRININKLIKRTSLNAYALTFHITKDIIYSGLANNILMDLGGCEELSSSYFYHEKIANAINCTV